MRFLKRIAGTVFLLALVVCILLSSLPVMVLGKLMERLEEQSGLELALEK